MDGARAWSHVAAQGAAGNPAVRGQKLGRYAYGDVSHFIRVRLWCRGWPELEGQFGAPRYERGQDHWGRSRDLAGAAQAVRTIRRALSLLIVLPTCLGALVS